MDIRTCADEVVRTLREHLARSLRGAWLVGSLAWSDFRPASSDIDVLAVANPRPPHVRQALAEALAAVKCPARGLEFVLYPTGPDQPFRWQLNLNTNPPHVSLDASTEPRHWFVLDVAMARERAIPICGPPAAELLAPIPAEQVHQALEESLAWHEQHEPDRPNAVLNACRAWRYAETGRWSSKTAAALWAREKVDDPGRIDAALASRHHRAFATSTRSAPALPEGTTPHRGY